MVAPGAELAIEHAEQAEQAARASGRPTPAWASRLLIAADSAELDSLDEQRATVERRMWERILRANTVAPFGTRQGLPFRHPDRLTLDELAPLLGTHRTVVNHHRRKWAARHPELIPTFVVEPPDAAAVPAGGATGPGTAAATTNQQGG